MEIRLRGDDGTDWLRSVGEAVVYELGQSYYAPLLEAHPEWRDELTRIMNERLTRREARRAQLESRPSVLARFADRVRRLRGSNP